MGKEKYICINCKEIFYRPFPDEKANECKTGYIHYIVNKSRLYKLVIKRKMVSL